MLKYCSPFIDIYITHIINFCIEKKCFPELWKEAIGLPIPKTSNPIEYSDLRIISILPCISKILEKILFKQIYEFVSINNIVPVCQSGFRQNFSTSNSLVQVIDDIITAADKKLISVLVLLDFSKAFDTINHHLLISKLKFYGFSNDALHFIESYLSNRKIKIKSNNSYSDFVDISSGVAQGSSLGPLFFIIYTAHILNSATNCNIQAYADDTQLYYSFSLNEFNRAQTLINDELNVIFNKSQQHNLKLNSTKSKVMIFTSRNYYNQIKNNININIDGKAIPVISTARNLGLIIDDDLRFKTHVNKLLHRSYTALKTLYSNRFVLNFNLRKSLSESLVLSLFNYCDFLYGPCLDNTYKNRIQKVQNSCVRFIYGLKKFDHISQNIKELKWLNMVNRRILHLNVFVHKMLIHKSGNIVDKLTQRSDIHSVNVRQKNKLTMPHHSTALFQRSFNYNAVFYYNKVPTDLKMLNVLALKNRLKAYLLDQQ